MADCLEKPPTKGFEFTVIYVDNCTGVVKDAFGTNTYDPRGGTVELEEGCSWGKMNQEIRTTVNDVSSITLLKGRHNPCCRWVFTARGWVCVPC